ncbi:DNA polymerase III subunit epsilon [Mangrovibrevibacter kandeliae]|uniref:DNA polymerase III subunit epsilon n=1 Tax=Mangrovibrevibacter kandeliae TaxID=2968473 RepID=UPI002119A39A|nr:DNA polymerase III subunit epsilon [Aurantimonas sp. CSK15Z-1]MCQ8782323.1 DNA polymerase III subunit epsilon [Aurantimonas sp. CSK15Z-1]
MREIVFDTETTGLDFEHDRVIEIGGIELWNHIPTGKSFHVYIRPVGRRVDPEAFDVHGLSDEFLADKPAFPEIADDFAAFFTGARLVAHNATFDVRFLNAELARLGLPAIPPDMVVDTLAMARRKFPMAPATLDALCSRFQIDTSRREKHGALLDSELLADVYIELIGGRQAALGLDMADERATSDGEAGLVQLKPRPRPLAPRLSPEEAARHLAFVRTLGEDALWLRVLAPVAVVETAE